LAPNVSEEIPAPEQRLPAGWAGDAEVDLARDDKFEVSGLADNLVELLAGVSAPFTLSLSGSWGVGKSTVANAIVERVRTRGVRALVIDAWTLDIPALRRRLVVEVGAALTVPGTAGVVDQGILELSRRKIAEKLDAARESRTEVHSARVDLRDSKDLWDSLMSHRTTLLAGVDIVLWSAFLAVVAGKDSGLQPIFSSLAATVLTLLVSGFVFRIVTPSVTRNPAAEELQLAAAFEGFVTGKDETGKAVEYLRPVVVVLDNLDRLSGDEALAALAQIRSFVELKGGRCVFLIPIDRRRLAEHLGRKLRDRAAASDYLEKFFNLDLALVQPEPVDLNAWAFDQGRALFGEEEEGEVRASAEVIVSAARRSPRAITRMLNGLLTRYRALQKLDSKMALRRLALVEGLLSFGPSLADQLALTPRVLTDAREALASKDTEVEQLQTLDELMEAVPAEDEDGQRIAAEIRRNIRAFLLENKDIPLEMQQVRLALALREDRLWGGVTEPDSVAVALEAGDKTAFDEAMEERSDAEKRLVLERGLNFMDRNQSSARLVAHVIMASGDALREQGDLNQKAYPIAVAALSHADVPLMTSLNGSAVEFLLGHEPTSGLIELHKRLIQAIWEAADEPIAPLVAGACVVVPQLVEEQLESLRTSLAQQDDDDLAPLFQKPPTVRLIEGQVATAVLSVLAGWDPTSGPHQRVVRLAGWLVDAAGASWKDTEGLRSLASTTQGKVPNLSPEPDSVEALDAICRLIGTISEPSSEIDQFATALAGRQEVGDAELFRSALRMPIQPGVLQATVGASLAAWMDTTSPERLEHLIESSGARVEEALPDYRDRLLNLWETQGNPQFARLAVGDDASQLDRLRDRWSSIDPAASFVRASEALEITGEVATKPALEAFVKAVGDRLPAIPNSALGGLPSFMGDLRSRAISRAPLIEAVEKRVQGMSNVADLRECWGPISSLATTAGPAQRRRVADALMERLVTFNASETDEAAWIVDNASTTQLLASLASQLVSRGLPLDPTLDVVRRARSRGLDSSEVFDALIARAASEATKDDAEHELSEAANWARPTSEDVASARANLDAVGANHPGLDRLVRKLRKTLPKGTNEP
jgi:hypothetical protein